MDHPDLLRSPPPNWGGIGGIGGIGGGRRRATLASRVRDEVLSAERASGYDRASDCVWNTGGDEARGEAWLVDKLISGTSFDPLDRGRCVTGAFEASGSGGSGHEHCQWTDEYGPDSMRPSCYRGVAESPADQEYRQQYAERAVADYTSPSPYFSPSRYASIGSSGSSSGGSGGSSGSDGGRGDVEYGYEHAPPKWRVIRPRQDEAANRLAATLAGEAAVETDARSVRHVAYDRFNLARDAAAVMVEQDARVRANPLSRLTPSTAGMPFFETPLRVEGSADLLRGHGCRLVRAEVTAYPQLAASLLSRPSSVLRSLYSTSPQQGLRMRETLESIADANSGEEISEMEKDVMHEIIRRHLDAAEDWLRDGASGAVDVERVLDPRMIEFVAPGDPHYVELGVVRASYDRVLATVSGEPDEMKEAVESVIFPLVIHMRNRAIPITVENVIAEAGALMQVREVLDRLDTGIGRQVRGGGVQAYMDAATDEELAILDQTSTEVIALLMPGNCQTTKLSPIYSEEDVEIMAAHAAETLFGPRAPAGFHPRPGVSSGGYGYAETRYAKPLRQRVDAPAVCDHDDVDRLVYDPLASTLATSHSRTSGGNPRLRRW